MKNFNINRLKSLHTITLCIFSIFHASLDQQKPRVSFHFNFNGLCRAGAGFLRCIAWTGQKSALTRATKKNTTIRTSSELAVDNTTYFVIASWDECIMYLFFVLVR